MTFLEDEHAVSELIGFIFVFAFVIILMSIWQAQVVPVENSKTEFEHYKGVQDDMSQLRSDYVDTAETGTTRSTTVKLGTLYPTRTLFINGSPPKVGSRQKCHQTAQLLQVSLVHPKFVV